MEVDTNRQNPLNLVDAWPCRSGRCCHGGSALELTTTDLAHVPRCLAPDPMLEAFLDTAPTRQGTSGKCCAARPTLLPSWAVGSRSGDTTTFSFTIPKTFLHTLAIQTKPLSISRQGIKRRRCVSDVDGFDTANLSSKKRRLRSELITSRLSQPYSQPATHILNREGQEAGDKRFLKMATSVDMTRRVAHLHATSFLRYSTMNRLRRRLSLAQGGDQEAAAITAKALRAMWRPQSLSVSSAGRSLGAPDSGTRLPILLASTRPPSAHTAPKPVVQNAKSSACRLSKPVSLFLPTIDAAATQRRTSLQIHPILSPELRPVPPVLDDLEEDSFAFMHPADDAWDDVGDDQDCVYSDFDVLFGQSAEDAEGEDRTYEEYLDELDGICWMSR